MTELNPSTCVIFRHQKKLGVFVPRPVLIIALAIVVLIVAAAVFGNHPGTSTVSNDEAGTRVDAPGARVETSGDGTRVQAPGVDITVPKNTGGE
jgi:hypothetical protein